MAPSSNPLARQIGRALVLVSPSRVTLHAVLAALCIMLAGSPLVSSPAEAASARAASTSATAQTARQQASAGVTSRRSGRHDPRPASSARHPAERRGELPRGETALSVLTTLNHAAQRAGAEPALLAAMAWRESRLDPLASNPRSSARGLMQFTEATWLEAIRDHGAAHGLAREAGALSTDRRTGRISAPNAREIGRLLDLRFDPQLSAALAAARMAAARTTLEAALARPVTSVDLYAVHLLGMAGARRFLAAHAGHRAADAVGAQVASLNRAVFFDEGGRAREVREVREAIARSTATGALLMTAAAAPNSPGNTLLAAATDVRR